MSAVFGQIPTKNRTARRRSFSSVSKRNSSHEENPRHLCHSTREIRIRRPIHPTFCYLQMSREVKSKAARAPIFCHPDNVQRVPSPAFRRRNRIESEPGNMPQSTSGDHGANTCLSDLEPSGLPTQSLFEARDCPESRAGNGSPVRIFDERKSRGKASEESCGIDRASAEVFCCCRAKSLRGSSRGSWVRFMGWTRTVCSRAGQSDRGSTLCAR